ncbi:MAG TPA: FMN-binding glutamate synthase family protein, partial [Psychromonas sp.]
MRKYVVFTVVFLLVLTGFLSFLWPSASWFLIILLPVIAVALVDMRQTRHALRRNFPVLAHGRWMVEFIRPYLRQYLFESDTDGQPINR